MSDLSAVSTMFEEVKHVLKRIEASLIKTNNNEKHENSINPIDLTEITDQITQSKNEIISKLEQVGQTLTTPKRVHHRISVDVKSSWVSFTLVGLLLSLITTLCLCYKLKQVNNQLNDNDLKYRYIKAFSKADSVSIYKLENVFEYNRDSKVIRKIRKSVEKYEQNVIDRARRLDQARLKEEEAKKLRETIQ
ncbi:hypothetical protein [Dysgonomonas massiliensis]|uniref:hypothetical protein n=1 Tax=Dysgonomonas massiliensis TaxID=2040292 RepID=UPI0011AF86BE|nr:hypothetical protein [Dysgonomonas massiliensis]